MPVTQKVKNKSKKQNKTLLSNWTDSESKGLLIQVDDESGSASNITEFTGILILMCEWYLISKKIERHCLCEQHICVVILQ